MACSLYYLFFRSPSVFIATGWHSCFYSRTTLLHEIHISYSLYKYFYNSATFSMPVQHSCNSPTFLYPVKYTCTRSPFPLPCTTFMKQLHNFIAGAPFLCQLHTFYSRNNIFVLEPSTTVWQDPSTTFWQEIVFYVPERRLEFGRYLRSDYYNYKVRVITHSYYSVRDYYSIS